MKITVYSQLEGAKVPNVVPPAYREAAQTVIDDAQAYSVLLFAHAERDVVPSAAVRRGLRRLDQTASGGIVAVGTVFTAEARALLEEAGAKIVALREGRWTDQSARERQL
jgi:hypothetical protein